MKMLEMGGKAEKLIPKTHGFGTKRLPLETNYFEVFNLPQVRLVDYQSDSGIERVVMATPYPHGRATERETPASAGRSVGAREARRQKKPPVSRGLLGGGGWGI